MVLVASPSFGEVIIEANFDAPTTRYAHGVLGDAIEYGALVLTLSSGKKLRLTLPLDHVFEDIAPRLIDVTADGSPEVVVIETDVRLGAALAVYDQTGKLAETPHIGRSNRWLAPIGGADLDGDGFIELAYIDRPHLARILTVWRFENGALTKIATKEGLTNHKIGQDFISGGVRDCGDGPEMITATADWSSLISSKLVNEAIQSTKIGPFKGQKSIIKAMNCYN